MGREHVGATSAPGGIGFTSTAAAPVPDATLPLPASLVAATSHATSRSIGTDPRTGPRMAGTQASSGHPARATEHGEPHLLAHSPPRSTVPPQETRHTRTM